MGLPGHRRTKSDKRRRAAHFALSAPTLTKDKKTGATHRPHRAAPGATEYNGKEIHVKGRDRKLQKLLEKTKSKTVEEETKKKAESRSPEKKSEKKPSAKKTKTDTEKKKTENKK